MSRIQSSDRCAVDMKPMAPSIRVRSTRIALLIVNLGSNIEASYVQYSPATYWCQLAASPCLHRWLIRHSPRAFLFKVRGAFGVGGLICHSREGGSPACYLYSRDHFVPGTSKSTSTVDSSRTTPSWLSVAFHSLITSRAFTL